ncbi:MAG: AAA family ATPase [Flavobacteriaceae bacterium]|nr:AAA family ATPase [Flavobacteriaceae bacterium]MBD10510.1 AAA family ATPase [Flavobacteriaceae bacterium]|tara:strand:+ start:6302 stop:7201 length:900 start_codon:yes stop_codon:yes gene_type:complete
MKLKQANREQVKLRIGISGASGFGKTYSALQLALGITNDYSKVAVIDTENESASLYSHLGNYNVLNLNPPYSPERYIEAIETCEKSNMEVIIIDSITHEWNGKGGCLEIHEKLGGKFQNWAQVSPRHQAFIDKILQSKCHVITTTRRKVDYSMDTEMGGKTKVVKHGTKEITREGYEYELTVNFELINENHLAKASKDRTGLFMNKPEFVINKSTGKKLMTWCNNGKDVSQARKEISECKTIEGLRHIYAKYPNYQKEIKSDIIERKALIEDVNLNVIPKSEIIQEQMQQKQNISDGTS